MEEIEIYRTAKRVIDQYGVDASIHVVKQTELMRERGNLKGVAVWTRIAWVVERLEVTKGRTRH